MPRPKTFYLIDGYAAIFRAFFAIRRPLYSPTTGEQTQAVLVFLRMLLKLYTTLEPDYVAVALDAPGATFRDAIYNEYPGAAVRGPAGPSETGETAETEAEGQALVSTAFYKGTRNETPDALSQQIPRILEALALFGIPTIGKPGLEADDIMATLTERILQNPDHADVHIRLVSKDKDLEQLLGDRVTLYDIHTGEERGDDALLARRGVTPAQIIDYLTLTGDTVDNVPGVPGIGPKTASRLLQQFGTLDGILANLDQIKGQCRENLEKSRPILPISRRLITLERGGDFPFDLDDARVRPLPEETMASFCETLGFGRLTEFFKGTGTL